VVQWFPQTSLILCLAYDPCTAHNYRLEVGGRPDTKPEGQRVKATKSQLSKSQRMSKVTIWIHKLGKDDFKPPRATLS
jgi:hypothetical protein